MPNKVKYKINKVCDRCEELKQTRYVGNQVYVCKHCDNRNNIFYDHEDRETLKFKKAV
jgi:formylmethanofuran dehydrogenase subunit E